MSKNTGKEQLKIHNAIRLLRLKQGQQLSDFKQQYKATAQSLKPSKIIAKTILDLYQESTVTKSALSNIMGFLSRKVIVGKSNTIFKSILGCIVQFVATKMVSYKIK